MELMKEDIEEIKQNAVRDAVREAVQRTEMETTQKVTREVTQKVTQDVKRKERQLSIQNSVDIYRAEMGLDDQDILQRISKRYQLTHEQARGYIVPQAKGTAPEVRA